MRSKSRNGQPNQNEQPNPNGRETPFRMKDDKPQLHSRRTFRHLSDDAIEILATPIGKYFRLSQRMKDRLTGNRIDYVYELARKTEDRIRRILSNENNAMEEIRFDLARNGLWFETQFTPGIMERIQNAILIGGSRPGLVYMAMPPGEIGMLIAENNILRRRWDEEGHVHATEKN